MKGYSINTPQAIRDFTATMLPAMPERKPYFELV